MMFGRYWYMAGDDGRHYCYSKHLSFECPVGSATVLGDILEQGAIDVGVEPAWVLKRLQHSAARVRDESGRYSDKCGTCGHKLVRLGYRYWIEAEPAKDRTAQMAATINTALGGSGFQMVEGPWYARTVKDAQAWMRQRVELAAKR